MSEMGHKPTLEWKDATPPLASVPSHKFAIVDTQ
jgi:hypothetical protein